VLIYCVQQQQVLAAVCEGRHLAAQRAASALVPVDMLLDLLDDRGVRDGHKGM
jgi:hypothetical protein